MRWVKSVVENRTRTAPSVAPKTPEQRVRLTKLRPMTLHALGLFRMPSAVLPPLRNAPTQHGMIDAERLADTAQRDFNLSVHLAKPQVDETGGEVRDQCLELETLLELVDSGPRSIDRGHDAESYRCEV